MEASLAQLTAPPSRVIRQQVSLLASPGTLGSLVVALVGVQALAGADLMATPPFNNRVPVFDVYPFLVIFGALWPAIVWHGEGPSRRLYHWALPVARAEHDIFRVVAGGFWLTLGLVSVEMFQVALVVLTGQGSSIAHLSLGTWINYVSGPVTMYLLVSALAIATDHPLRWMVGWVFGVAVGVSSCRGSTCSNSVVITALRHFFGLSDVLAPYISPEVYQRRGVTPGPGALMLILSGLSVGAAAVYGAAKLRSRSA